MAATTRVELESEGRMIVRRFTEELEGNTELEKATKKAQEDEDREHERAEQLRVQKIFDAFTGNTYMPLHAPTRSVLT